MVGRLPMWLARTDKNKAPTVLICQLLDCGWSPVRALCPLSNCFVSSRSTDALSFFVQQGSDFPHILKKESIFFWTQHPHPPFKPHPFPSKDYFCVWFLVRPAVLIRSRVGGSQLTSTPSFAARRCRCTWSCSSSSWLGCQSRDRMRSMLRAYMVWEGITPWCTCVRQIFQIDN